MHFEGLFYFKSKPVEELRGSGKEAQFFFLFQIAIKIALSPTLVANACLLYSLMFSPKLAFPVSKKEFWATTKSACV